MIKGHIKSPVMKIIWVCIMVYAFVIICAMLTSCSTLEKKIEKAKIVAYQNPNSFTDICSKLFPPIHKEGKTVYLPSDTVYVKADSVKCPDVVNPVTGEKKEGVKVACPPSKTIYVPSVRVDTVESTASLAKIKGLELELEANRVSLAIEKDKRLEAENKAKTRMWWLIGIAGLAAVYVGLKVKKIIPF